MSTKHSTVPIVQLNWVVQALANFKQVDASTLLDLVKNPEISDDLGKDAREMLSFRILESLFVQGNGPTDDADSVPDTKIGFDPSERCEDVLCWIFHEQTSGVNLMAESEKLKWDVQPFIMHKRSCLPKCTLQQLKEAILEGSHPLLASLKERSGLVVANKSEKRTQVVDGGFNAQTFEEDLPSLNPENGDDELQENLSHAKKVRKFSATEISGEPLRKNQVTMDNGCDPYLNESNPAKKLKQNVICTRQTVELDSVSLHTGRVENDLSIKAPVEGLEECRLPNNSHDEYAASLKLGESCDVDDAMLHDQQQVPCNDDKVAEDTPREGQDHRSLVDDSKEESEGLDEMRKLNSIGNSKGNCEGNFQPNAFNGRPPGEAKDNLEKDCEPEMCCDSDELGDERPDIATKKLTFLSSQCTQSQDSLAVTEWTEVSLCMKCNEGSQLLVCSSEACPLCVHESCLGSTVTFDGSGKFYCPFCVYSRAISKYLEVKRKVPLARKDLEAFIGFGMKCRPKKSSERLSGSVQNQLRRDEDLDENNDANQVPNNVNRVNNNQSRLNKEDTVLAEPSVSFVNDDPLFGGKGAAVTNGTNCGLMGDEREGQRRGQECPAPRGMVDQQIATLAVSNCESNISSSKGQETELRSEEHAEIQIQSGVLNQPITDLPHETVCTPSIPHIQQFRM